MILSLEFYKERLSGYVAQILKAVDYGCIEIV